MPRFYEESGRLDGEIRRRIYIETRAQLIDDAFEPVHATGVGDPQQRADALVAVLDPLGQELALPPGLFHVSRHSGLRLLQSPDQRLNLLKQIWPGGLVTGGSLRSLLDRLNPMLSHVQFTQRRMDVRLEALQKILKFVPRCSGRDLLPPEQSDQLGDSPLESGDLLTKFNRPAFPLQPLFVHVLDRLPQGHLEALELDRDLLVGLSALEQQISQVGEERFERQRLLLQRHQQTRPEQQSLIKPTRRFDGSLNRIFSHRRFRIGAVG